MADNKLYYGDNLGVLRRHVADESVDLVYLDPPYAVGNRRIFRQYGPMSFGLNDLSRLAASLESLDRKGATFVVSYAVCPEALSIFSCWHIRRVFTQRNISGFAKHRRKAAELMISNREPNL